MEKERGGNFGKVISSIIGILALMAASAILTGYIIKTKPQVLGLSAGTQPSQAEADALIEKVGKLMALPTDEKPTIATVNDASKVKDQQFFSNSENGDKVLIYQKAQRAILYRPSSNIIVEVGSVTINQSQAPSPSPTSSPKK